MKTNFDKLTGFEMGAIVLTVVGIVLIGWVAYYTIPTQTQTQFAEAIEIFDMHKDFSQFANKAIDNFRFVASTTQEFYDQFALAFEQEFSFPDQVGVRVIAFTENLSEYARYVASVYQQNNIVAQQEYATQIALGFESSKSLIGSENFAPTIAGISTSANIIDCPEQKEILKLPYHYDSPAFIKKYFQ